MKDYKRMMKQGKDIAALDFVINELLNLSQLPEKYCDHYLKGEYIGYKECRIEHDRLLIYGYAVPGKEGCQLLSVRTGSHVDLLA